MGGIGSGRWAFREKAVTVEQCHRLDIGRLAGALRPGVHRSGSFQLRHSWQEISLDWEIHSLNDSGWVLLAYTLPFARGWIEQAVELTTTRPHFGGLRWWFRCPLSGQGERCSRRVGKLHMPPGARHFGCRACHQLTYKSSQTSHTLDPWTRLGRLLDMAEEARSGR